MLAPAVVAAARTMGATSSTGSRAPPPKPGALRRPAPAAGRPRSAAPARRRRLAGENTQATDDGGERMTNLAANLEATARRHPDRPAVRLDDEVLTYADLWDLSGRVVGWLRHQGVR